MKNEKKFFNDLKFLKIKKTFKIWKIHIIDIGMKVKSSVLGISICKKKKKFIYIDLKIIFFLSSVNVCTGKNFE